MGEPVLSHRARALAAALCAGHGLDFDLVAGDPEIMNGLRISDTRTGVQIHPGPRFLRSGHHIPHGDGFDERLAKEVRLHWSTPIASAFRRLGGPGYAGHTVLVPAIVKAVAEAEGVPSARLTKHFVSKKDGRCIVDSDYNFQPGAIRVSTRHDMPDCLFHLEITGGPESGVAASSWYQTTLRGLPHQIGHALEGLRIHQVISHPLLAAGTPGGDVTIHHVESAGDSKRVTLYHRPSWVQAAPSPSGYDDRWIGLMLQGDHMFETIVPKGPQVGT